MASTFIDYRAYSQSGPKNQAVNLTAWIPGATNCAMKLPAAQPRASAFGGVTDSRGCGRHDGGNPAGAAHRNLRRKASTKAWSAFFENISKGEKPRLQARVQVSKSSAAVITRFGHAFNGH
jgi:hypothetical protein